MRDLDDFIQTDLKEASRIRLYAGMLEGLLLDRIVYSQIFNRFSVKIDFSLSTVTVEDDIFPEDGIIEMPLSKFFELINLDEG